MFNLIRKDIILQKTTLLIMVAAIIVYLLLGTSSIWVGIIFSIVMITTIYSTDEKSSINMLLNSLPYTRKEIVSSKYIGAIIFTCAIVFIIFIGNLMIHQEIVAWKALLFIVSVVMVSISLFFPFAYKFKSQYMMLVSLVLFGAYMIVIRLFVPNLNDKIRELVQILLSLENVQFYIIVGLAVTVLYVCSWLLSIRIYEKKVF